MARRRRKNYRDLVLPVAVLAALWVFTNPDAALALAWWAAVITAAVAAAAVAFSVLRNKQVRRTTASPVSVGHRPTKLSASHQRVDALDALWQDRSQAPALATEAEHPPSAPAWSREVIRQLEWKRFEELCAAYFEAKGYKVELTGAGADGGVDFYLYGKTGDGSKRLGIVQCKSWASHRVGVKAVRELLGVMTDTGCPLGVFITTSSYTEEAERFAAGKHIQLVDGERMLRLIQALPAAEQAKLLKLATRGDYRTPSCPSCGTKLTLRTARRGRGIGRRFWGCKNYPRCRYTLEAASSS